MNVLTKEFIKAVNFEKNGYYVDAMNSYVELLKRDENFREAYVNLGALYLRMGKYKLSMRCNEKALNLKEDYITYFNIGSTYYKQKRYKDAVINLEKARGLRSQFYLASLVIGLCYSRLKNYKAAKTNFLNLLKIIPNNRVALTALSIIYFNEKNFDKSLLLLNKLLEIDSQNFKIRDLKSTILLKIGDTKTLKEEINSVREISDGYKFYDEFIKAVPVQAYTDSYGTIDEKINNLESLKSKDRDSLISLSLCYLFKGESDKAIDSLLEAKTI